MCKSWGEVMYILPNNIRALLLYKMKTVCFMCEYVRSVILHNDEILNVDKRFEYAELGLMRC